MELNAYNLAEIQHQSQNWWTLNYTLLHRQLCKTSLTSASDMEHAQCGVSPTGDPLLINNEQLTSVMLPQSAGLGGRRWSLRVWQSLRHWVPLQENRAVSQCSLHRQSPEHHVCVLLCRKQWSPPQISDDKIRQKVRQYPEYSSLFETLIQFNSRWFVKGFVNRHAHKAA